jgi:hypothetical protein
MRRTILNILLGIGALGAGYWLGSPPCVGTPGAAASARSTAATATVSTAALREDAVNSVASALLNRDVFHELARIGELLESLDPSQLGALADRIDAMRYEDREVLLPRFIAYWAKRDPQAATKWMELHLAGFAKERWFGNGFASFETHLVNAWADNAPELAFDIARQYAGTGLSGIILSNAIHRWPDKDDGKRFEVLRGFPPGKDRQRAMVSFCFTWAQTDRAGALAAVKTLQPGPERDGALSEILAQWAASETSVAFDQAKALGLNSPGLMAVMVKEGAKTNPGVVAQWCEKQAPEMASQLGPVVVQFWAARDPVAAFQWATAHGIPITESAERAVREIPSDTFLGHRFELGMSSPLAAAMRENPDATLGWVRGLPPGRERERYLEMIVAAGSDGAKLQPLLSELSGEAAVRAAGKLASNLGYKDFEKAREWAASLPMGASREAAWIALGAQRTEPLDLPPGPDRDALFSGMATGQYHSAPVKSLERVLQIENPALRRRTFDDVMAMITRGDLELGYNARVHGVPASELEKVQAWLATAKVPGDWKEPWMK